MAIAGSLVVVASVKTQKMKKGLDSAGGSIKNFASKIPGASKMMTMFSGGLNPATLALAAVAAAVVVAVVAFKLFKASVRRVLKEMDALDLIGKKAASIGITTEALIGLQHAGSLAGVSTSVLDSSLQKMTKNVSEAAAGTGMAKNALREMGLEAKTLNAMSTDKQFAAIADALQGVANHSDKVRLAQQLMGRQGTDLLNMMKGGSEGLNAQLADTKRLWTSVSTVDTAMVEKANDEMYRFGEAIKGVWRQFTVFLSPAITEITSIATGMFLDARDGAMEFAKGMAPFRKILLLPLTMAVTKLRAIHATFLLTRGVISGTVATIAKGVAWLTGDDTTKFFAEDLANKASADMTKANEILRKAPYDIAEAWEKNTAKWRSVAAIQARDQAALANALRQNLIASEATEGVEKLLDKYKDLTKTFGMAGRQAEIHKLKVQGANRELVRQAYFQDAILTQKEKELQAQKDWKSATEKATNTIKEQKLQIRTLQRGWNPRQVEIYRQSLARIPSHLLYQLRISDRILTNMEKQKKTYDEMRNRLKSLKDQMIEFAITPAEKYRAIMRDVILLVDKDPRDNLTVEMGVKFLKEQEKQLGLIKDKEEEINGIRYGAAAEFGSKEARAIILASRGDVRPVPLPPPRPTLTEQRREALGRRKAVRFPAAERDRELRRPSSQPQQLQDPRLIDILDQLNEHVSRMVPQLNTIAQRADDPRLAEV